jgi:hypothetical protein
MTIVTGLTAPKMRRTLFTIGIQLLWLLGASETLALTPEEADRAIQQGLEAQSIRSARNFYEVTKFSSREAIAQRLLAGTRSGHEYTLLVRSCRQLLRFAAFQSKTDKAIDLESLRSSCLAQDRVWVAIDEGEQTLLTSGLLKKLIGRPKRQPAVTRVTRFEVVLDGEAVEPLGQIDVEELGLGSTAAIFAAEPFLEAEHGEITVTMGETQQAVGELKSQLLRRLFGQQ